MPTTYFETAELVGVESGGVRIAFDRRTGRLASLRNRQTQDEYLKEPRDTGNPFRVYTDFIRPFELEDDPADIARVALDPESCRLVSAERSDEAHAAGLKLVYRDRADQWEIRLGVMPADAGSSQWTLEVVNIGNVPRKVMVDFPLVHRVCLGKSRDSNIATFLDQAGYVSPASRHRGGTYGNGGEWSMQWHCVYDPDSGGALGLIVKDPDVRNKRLGEGSPSLRVSTFPEHELGPGERLSLPPVQLLVYQGDWRRTAREYGAWFAQAFQILPPPEWLRRCDGWLGRWFGKRGGATQSGACQLDSFRDLPNLYVSSATMDACRLRLAEL